MDDTTLLLNLRSLEATPDQFHPNNPELWNELLVACTCRRELRACVLIYDAMVARKVPLSQAFAILDTVHSKTIEERDTLLLGPVDMGKLAAKRRIHKIMKGYHYSHNYNTACVKHLAGVTAHLNKNPELKTLHKDKLCKILSRDCGVPVKDVKYVITKLKRTRFLGTTKIS